MKSTLSIAIIVVFSFLTEACTKSSVSDKHAPADSTTLNQADTMYLKKTETYYTLTDGNPIPTDSQRHEFQYDDKRRITLTVDFSASSHSTDTTIYRYFSNYYKASSVTYVSGNLSGHAELICYQREGLTPDSIINSYYPGAGDVATSTSKNIYLKDGNGNDTLEMYSRFTTGSPASSNYSRCFYIGSVLDSVYLSDPVFSYKYSYSAGELMTVKTYNNGVFYSTVDYTYTNIPNRGFFVGVNAGPFLPARAHSISAPGAGGYESVGTFCYNLDAAGRVVTERLTNSQSPTIQVYIYTYY